MAKATWNEMVLAQSNDTLIIDGNHYFPPESVNKQYLLESNTHSNCPWKGTANYYDIEVNGQINKDAAWFYPNAKEKAKHFEGYVAFWRGVQIEA